MTHLMRNLLSLLLAMLLVLMPVAMVGCSTEDTLGGDGTNTVAQTAASTEAEETEGEPNWAEMPYAEKAGKISVFGTPLSEFRIVIPKECDLFTRYAAQNLADYIYYNTSYYLRIVTDDQEPRAHELLVGATNRPASQLATAETLAEDAFIVMKDGGSIVLYGKGYMVGGAAGAFINRYAAGAWRGYDIDIADIPTTLTHQTFAYQPARNAVLLIGDGMGKEHINLTYSGTGRVFSAAQMPMRGEIITKSQTVINGGASATDSAASGTALSTGFKTTNGYVGVDPANQKLTNVRELAQEAGAKTAILSTDAITGATPASFLCHHNDRNNSSVLQAQITQLQKAQAVEHAVGSLTDSSFMESSTHALQSVSKHGSAFFAMIEEGYIDKYAHNNDADGVKHTVERLDALVAYCMEFVLFHPDTVLIVTADHETGGITPAGNGGFRFTSGGHTNVNVPIYAMGSGTDYFDDTIRDNTRVPVFIAALYTEKPFGDPAYRQGEY